MLDSYSESVAPGTAANRARQAKAYLQFSVYYDVQHLFPKSSQLCMYAQYLYNSHSSPQSVKNYMSGARTWVTEHGGDPSAFDDHDVQQILKGFVKKSSHVPQRAVPLASHHILQIATYVSFNPAVPKSVLPCIVIGFKCFLRSSNLLSPSMRVWGGPHTLLARNVIVTDKGLLLTIDSTKTKWDNSASEILLPPEPNSRVCPVALWTHYYRTVKPWYLGPAFLTDSHLPLTARHVVTVMRAALSSAKDIDSGKLSMHSLRRGAVQEAVLNDVPLDQIKEAGMWRSTSGVKPYLDKFPHIFKR